MEIHQTGERRAKPWPVFGSGGLDDAYVRRLTDFVDARLYLADHRVLLLLKCMLCSELPDAVFTRARKSVLNFRFSLLEPGNDAMALWTENHQITAATAEYLTGQLFPDEVFRNDGRIGARHWRAARSQLMIWLSDRFRYGFSEWLSNTYLAYDLAALAMLIDHADDETLVRAASMIADLALTDVALHSFQGRFAPSMGRAHAEQAMHPERAEMAPIWASAFGDEQPEPDIESLSGLFITRQRYQVPAAIREIARDQPVRRVMSSMGLDPCEVRSELRSHPQFPRTQGLELTQFWWGMQAVATPETIVESMRSMRALELEHRMLAPLRRFKRLPDRALTPTLLALNPITTGAALYRANVQTLATSNYLLSSVQRYQPGGFGDQQHLWHASMPGGIEVFGNHPGSTELLQESRSASPGPWVGNGINPDIGQHFNVLLAQYDLRQRKGFFEGRRHELVHIHFPFVLFDQTRLGPTWVAGRRGNSYIGIVASHHFEQISETEIVQRGTQTGYAVVMADDEEFSSLADFLRELKQSRLSLSAHRLSLASPSGGFELVWKGEFRVNGRPVNTQYPRYESPSVQAPRNPEQLVVTGTDHQLRLDWMASTREETQLVR